MGLGRGSTALDAVQGHDLSGKVAVVTGGNSGIGAETVRALAAAGARVILTARDPAAGQAVADRLQEEAHGLKGSIEVRRLDLADLVSVQQLGGDLARDLQKLDLLILNAGVMMCPRSFSKDGFELQWATNHLGHAALTQALLPRLQAQGTPARIVILSSSAHQLQRTAISWDDLDYSKRKYTPRAAYGQSKLANVLYAKALATQLKDTQVSAYAVHPGIVETPLWRHMWSQGSCFGGLFSMLSRLSIFGVKTAAQGAATSIFAATSPELEGKSGTYLVDCHEATPTRQAQVAKQAAKLLEVTEAQLVRARTTRASLNAALADGGSQKSAPTEDMKPAGPAAAGKPSAHAHANAAAMAAEG